MDQTILANFGSLNYDNLQRYRRSLPFWIRPTGFGTLIASIIVAASFKQDFVTNQVDWKGSAPWSCIYS